MITLQHKEITIKRRDCIIHLLLTSVLPASYRFSFVQPVSSPRTDLVDEIFFPGKCYSSGEVSRLSVGFRPLAHIERSSWTFFTS